MEHRTLDRVIEVDALVDQMFASASVMNNTDGARHLSIPRVDSSTCFRCGARFGQCEHTDKAAQIAMDERRATIERLAQRHQSHPEDLTRLFA